MATLRGLEGRSLPFKPPLELSARHEVNICVSPSGRQVAHGAMTLLQRVQTVGTTGFEPVWRRRGGQEQAADLFAQSPAQRLPLAAERTVERVVEKLVQWSKRRRLPNRRKGYTQKATVGGHKILSVHWRAMRVFAILSANSVPVLRVPPRPTTAAGVPGSNR